MNVNSDDKICCAQGVSDFGMDVLCYVFCVRESKIVREKSGCQGRDKGREG